MPYFDRFDICEAHWVLEMEWNAGGVLWEREQNAQRRQSTGVQLSRLQFHPKPNLCWDTLTDNGKEIYNELSERYGLDF